MITTFPDVPACRCLRLLPHDRFGWYAHDHCSHCSPPSALAGVHVLTLLEKDIVFKIRSCQACSCPQRPLLRPWYDSFWPRLSAETLSKTELTVPTMLNVSRHTRNLFESVLVLKKLTEARSMEQRPNRESHCKHRDKNKSIHISSIYVCVCFFTYIFICTYFSMYSYQNIHA